MANLQPLRNYVRQHLSRLQSSPCLVVTSAPPPADSTAVAGTKSPYSISSDERERKERRERLEFQRRQNDPRMHAFVQRNVQSLAMEFNLRSVPCTISSAFPTSEGVDEAVSLAKRAGLKGGGGGGSGSSPGVDGVIIGIGSGAAMDLAKAVADSIFGNVASCSRDDLGNDDDDGGSLVLAPSTLGGLWAASSNSPSLLLDTKEEMILPHLTPSWRDDVLATEVPRRRGTVVALDHPKQMVMPLLFSRFQPARRSEHSPAPSMAQMAAAALAIVLDAARSVDEAAKQGTADERGAQLKQSAIAEMRSVASSCASVLKLAAQDAERDGGGGDNDRTELARQHLLDAIPRLSPLVEQSSLLAQTPILAAGTIPQKLANALLPAYFPQCHVVTYLACILPGLCDVLSSSSSSSSGGTMSTVENVANSIIHCGENDGEGNADGASMLSSWASRVAADAGIPSMASLAFGTPDLNALAGSLDSYEALIASLDGGSFASVGGGGDGNWIMEDVLQRSLSR